MQDYILCCGSTADLSAQRLKERNIEYIPFHFFLDGKEYTDDLGQTITYPDFYAAMARGAMTSTSQTNADEFERAFTLSPLLATLYRLPTNNPPKKAPNKINTTNTHFEISSIVFFFFIYHPPPFF